MTQVSKGGSAMNICGILGSFLQLTEEHGEHRACHMGGVQRAAGLLMGSAGARGVGNKEAGLLCASPPAGQFALLTTSLGSIPSVPSARFLSTRPEKGKRVSWHNCPRH